MAVQTTEEFKNGGATSYAITIEYLKASDIKVRIGGALQTYTTGTPGSGEYSVSGTTVTLGAAAPSGSGNVHIYRETDVNTAAAVFQPGSSIRAADLNNIHDMARFSSVEHRNQVITANIKDGQVTSAKIEDGTIVNADINASAAIDGTKISPNFGSQNIVTSGTVDGRDVSVDGTKLDGIETGATADQTAAEIKTLVGSATDSNVYTDAEKTKLTGIETGATADQTNAEIRAAVEAASDSNVFTDADHTKLNNIETGATADQTGAEIKSAYEAESNTNAFTDAEKTKLSGIATGADVTSSNSINALTDVNTSGAADGKILKYDASSSAFIIADDGGSGSGGSTTFTGLSDTPANFGSAAGKTLKVNSAGNAVEFVTVTTPAGNFAGLTDTPANFTGAANKTVKVNSAANALEFVDVATDVVDDTTPQLGGNLDVQDKELNTSTTNGNIKLTPNGTGKVEVKGNTNAGSIQLNCENNSHGVTIKGPAHSATANYTLTLPTALSGNNAGHALKTDGLGQLSFGSVLSGNSEVIALYDQSSTPIQRLLATTEGVTVQGTSAGVSKLIFRDRTTANYVKFKPVDTLSATVEFTLPSADGTNGQYLKTNGSGVLSFADVSSTYNIQINTLSSSSGTGGGSASFNNIATRFTLSNAGPNAQAHLVSVNGVIQKPNSGTSPSEGFAIDGNDIIFASAPASGSDFFILTLGNAIGVGTPSDNTVTAAKIASGAVEQAKVAGEAINESKLQVSNAPTNGYYLQAQSGNAGGMTWAEVEAGAKQDIFWENGQTVSSNYTITNGKNAMSAGPITINNGIAVTIGTGENWTIV